MDRFAYDFHLDDNDPENFPDVTERDLPDHPPEDNDDDTRPSSRLTAEDFIYDPLSRKGWD